MAYYHRIGKLVIYILVATFCWELLTYAFDTPQTMNVMQFLVLSIGFPILLGMYLKGAGATYGVLFGSVYAAHVIATAIFFFVPLLLVPIRPISIQNGLLIIPFLFLGALFFSAAYLCGVSIRKKFLHIHS